MKEIPLTKGRYGAFVALVDDADYEWLNQHKWYAGKRRQSWYAYRGTEENGHKIAMHQMILRTPKGMKTDHRNGDGLDNRRENIRICTNTENVRNQRTQQRQKSSVFKGVHWCATYKRWVSKIKVNHRRIYLGRFHNEVEAALAYDVGALKYHKEFAKFNFMEV